MSKSVNTKFSKLSWVHKRLNGKRTVSLIIAVVLIFSAFAFTASAKTQTVANVQDAMKLCIEGDLIKIRKGTLYTGGKKVGTVYAILLAGSDMKWDKNDINGLQTCIKSGFSKDNLYLDALIKAAKKSIPKNSKIVFMGHSLGGMVAQQFAADEEMKARYEILNILTMGSPYIVTKNREGGLHRMADSGDAIPYMSGAFIANFWAGNFTYKCNGYFGNPDAAHNDSYRFAEKWRKYDCFGIENGTSKIVLK